MDELKALDVKSLPVSVRGRDVVVGYNVAELCETFGIDAGAGGPMHPERMMEMIRLVFGALKRAVNQLSIEQFDWISPGRPRSMRQPLWHSFERPVLGIEAYESGNHTKKMVRAMRNSPRIIPHMGKSAPTVTASRASWLNSSPSAIG